MKTANNTSTAALASCMAQGATNKQAERMKALLVSAGLGDREIGDIDDTIWQTLLGMAAR